MSQILHLPDEILLIILTNVEDVKDTRLVCKKFSEIAAELLLNTVTVLPTNNSLDRLASISAHPLIRKGIANIRVQTFGFAPEVLDLGRFRALWPTKTAHWTDAVHSGIQDRLGRPITSPAEFTRKVALYMSRLPRAIDLDIKDYETGDTGEENYLKYLVSKYPKPPKGHRSVEGVTLSLAHMYRKVAGRWLANGEASFAQAVCVDLPIYAYRQGKSVRSYRLTLVSPFTREALGQALPVGGQLVTQWQAAIGASAVVFEERADRPRAQCLQGIPIPQNAGLGEFGRILRGN
ncbi:hypothetical protein RB593_001539 [Gaeumannomyces tritici]